MPLPLLCVQLSGGERSYTTVAFTLALGGHTEMPFRAMDEFDVVGGVGCLAVGLLVGWLSVGSKGLVGWVDGQLVGWLAGWLVN